MSYVKYKLMISKGQKDKLKQAVESKCAVSIRLGKNELDGEDLLLLTKNQITKITKAKSKGGGCGPTVK